MDSSTNWFESYCNDSFWNADDTWYTDEPRLSRCFRQTALTFVPFLLLWVLTPFEISLIVHKRCKPISWNRFNCSRLLVCLLLIIIQCVELVYFYDYFQPHSNSIGRSLTDVAAPLLKIFTLILLLSILLHHRKYGIRNSGFVWIFLLLVCCFQLPIILDIHLYNSTAYDLIEVIIIHATFLLLVLLLVLCSFVDQDSQSVFLLNQLGGSDESKRILKAVDLNRKVSPEPHVSFVSRITFWWFGDLIRLGYRRPLVTNDLWSMRPSDKIVRIVSDFGHTLNRQLVKRQAKQKQETKQTIRVNQGILFFTILSNFGPYFVLGSLFKFLFDLMQFVNPQLLSILISFTKDSEAKHWHGILIALAMLASTTVQSVIINVYFQRMFVIAIKIKSALVDLVYRKSLRLSPSARRNRTSGEIVNLLSVDSQRFMEVLPYINLIWSAPLQIVLSIYFLYQQLGVSVFAGVGVILLMIPINSVIVNFSKKIQLSQMHQKDERIKLINEILNGMKVIKLYGWEGAFLNRVQAVRQKELHHLKTFSYLGSVTTFFFNAAPLLVSLSTFWVYITIDPNNELTAEKAFVSISLFNILQFPLTLMPQVINYIIMASVSLQRIGSFLNADELEPYVQRNADATNAVEIRDQVNFSWDMNSPGDTKTPKESKDSKKLRRNGSESLVVAYSNGNSPNSKAPVTNQNGHSNDESSQKDGDEQNSVQIKLNESSDATGGKRSPNASEASSKGSTRNGTSGLLQDISLCIRRQSLVAVVGGVGCGKSSFLSALLGEMQAYRTDGKAPYVNIAADLKMAYAPQQAWIQNATVRDNILFGREMDESRYWKVIDACALTSDLKLLPAGDLTEIGEKGINLSGGQKQRVSLARLCYADADLVLLDDPLSAVDAHVSKHLFGRVIGTGTGLLQQKTRVLVTNQLTYLKHVDQILVFDQGKLALDCTYDELLAYSDRHGSNALKRFGIQLDPPKSPTAEDLHHQSTESHDGDRSMNRSQSIERPRSDSETKKEAMNVEGRLIDQEKVEVDVVKMRDYFTYLSNFGVWYVLFTLIGNAAHYSLSLGANVWLAKWSNGPDEPTDHNHLADFNRSQLSVYGMLGFGQCVVMVIAFYLLILGGLRASFNFHTGLIWHVIRSPMSFFDTTPIGRIVNRFSRDIDTIDSLIPNTIRTFIMCFLRILGTFVIITYKTPLFAFVLVPIIVIYYFIQRFYVATTRQLKRLDSITRSPIYSHFGETLSGCSTIRAYSKTQAFINESNAKVELNNICYYPSMVANRWLSIRLEFLGNIMVFSTAMFAVYSKDVLDAGTVGLIVSYAINITQVLSWQVRMISELETNLVSVERINEYKENKLEDEWEKYVRPPADWPKHGAIQFENYTTTYRVGMDPVLKNIDLNVRPLEKVGIVGRTGAGKSTVTLALFRIIEPTHGRIVIDGLDINRIGLHDLRSKLAIIPQEPVLFSGTIRFNLDPFDQYSDEQVWKVLELSHLRPLINDFPAGLGHLVAEGGENLSVGQRQLICLARALLKNAKILILDEATASVDYVTDSLIQDTIRKEFAEATTITIAHRINTILDSSKILVLDRGTVKEFDTPDRLLTDRKSLFYSLAKSAEIIRK